MKKLLAILAFLPCLLAFSAQEFQGAKLSEYPCAIIKTCPPKKLFSKLNLALRKTYPDPKVEMAAALALAPFGYPFFEGVSKNDCAAVLYYQKDGKIFRVAAVCADESSAISRYADRMKIPHMRADSWLILGESFPEGENIKDYWEYAVKTARQVEIADFSITLYPDCDFPEDFKSFEDLLNQAESIKVSTRISEESINLKCKLKAEPKSPFARFFNSMPCRDRTFDESRFIPQDAAVTILTKINPASGTYGGGEIFSAQYELLPADIYKSRQLFKGTGACIIDAGTALSVYASERSIKDIKEHYKTALSCTGIEGNYLKTEFEEGFEIIEIAGETKTYISAAKGFEAVSNSRAALLDALKKIKDPVIENWPLKEFDNTNSEIIAILETKKFIEQFIPTSIKFNKLPQTVFDITSLRDSIELSTLLHYDILKAALAICNEYLMAQSAAENGGAIKTK